MNHLWRVSSGRSWCLCPTMVGYWYVPNSRPWSAIGPHPDAVRHLWSVEGRHVANIFLLLQLELLEVQQSVQRINDAQSHNVSFGVYSLTLWPLFPKIERNEKKWSATGVFTIHQVCMHLFVWSCSICDTISHHDTVMNSLGVVPFVWPACLPLWWLTCMGHYWHWQDDVPHNSLSVLVVN